MSRESIIFTLGIVVAVTSFLGIPGDWKQWVFVVAGTIITILGYQLRRKAYLRSIETTRGERRADAFVENHAPAELSDFTAPHDERLSI